MADAATDVRREEGELREESGGDGGGARQAPAPEDEPPTNPKRQRNNPVHDDDDDDDDTVEELLQMLETSTCQVTMATQELVRRCDGASDALAQARQRLKAQAASHESALAALRSQLAEARSALAAERQAADDLRAAIKDADAAVAQAVEGVRAALAEMGVAALAPAPPADGEPAPSKVSWVLGAARETVRAAKGYGWWSVRVAMRRAVAALRRQGCTHLHQAAFLEECADEEESEVVDTVVEGFLTKAWNRYGADAKLRAIADAVQQRRNRNLPPSPSPSPGVAVQ
ncbi:hypothetical protein BS78_04G005400 [Paspalum vaginatum]|nr:hypothetical protein BS78_04G005400 [Paspalum vaginatum]